MTIYILYSADYELFLGGNYCDEKEVLINPTSNLLEIFDNLKIPLTLFADIFSILRYKELNLFTFPENAEDQLKNAIRRGHDVQSHVHPHWNFTRIEGNKYSINPDYFLLGKLDDNPEELYQKIRNYLMTSRLYLNNLLRQINADYDCIAFRAGGYGLQPNPTIIIRALRDTGFIIDSSIIPGYVFFSNVNEIDFSGVPKTANYYLDSDLGNQSKENKGIFEIPIGSCEFSSVENFLLQIKFLGKFVLKKIISGESVKEKGYAIQLSGAESKSGFHNYFKSSHNRFYHLDCSTNDEKMFQCTKKYVTQFDHFNQNIFFAFNIHPKILTPEHFDALQKYHDKLKIHYQDNIQAITYQQAARMLLQEMT